MSPLDFVCNQLSPGEVPIELQNLNIMEKRCISLINTFFSLLVLPAYPIGQLGMRDLAIHLPMQIPELVNKLPRDGQNANIAFVYSAATCKPKIVRVKKGG
jgi:hypothetical protein